MYIYYTDFSCQHINSTREKNTLSLSLLYITSCKFLLTDDLFLIILIIYLYPQCLVHWLIYGRHSTKVENVVIEIVQENFTQRKEFHRQLNSNISNQGYKYPHVKKFHKQHQNAWEERDIQKSTSCSVNTKSPPLMQLKMSVWW